jgi:hypothetical protein
MKMVIIVLIIMPSTPMPIGFVEKEKKGAH